MADVIVLGGSLAGLSTAMMLNRRGHRVTVIERDAAAPVDKQQAALEWTRPSTPQHHHSHVLLTRGVQVLRDELPDVLEDLLDQGANHIPMFAYLPPPIAEREPRPGDEDIESLCVRRPVLDWALERGIARDEIPVVHEIARDLVTEGAAVKGVVTETQTLLADVVIDASGRRTRVPRWLADRGITVPEQRSPCGCTYLSRVYTLRGAAPGPFLMGFATVGPGDGFETLVFRGDDETYTISMQINCDDKDMLVARDPAAFEAIVAKLPWASPWLEAGQPLGDVHVMAGLDNTSHQLVVDGQPLVTGLLQVGDSAATTNPTLGRGMTLALMGAQLVARVMDDVTDPAQQLLALDALRTKEIDPYVTEAWGVDERNIARQRHRLFGDPPPALPSQAVPEEVLPFMFTERDAWHRTVRKNHLLTHPSTLYDEDLGARVVAARSGPAMMPPPPVTREDCLDAARQAVAGAPSG